MVPPIRDPWKVHSIQTVINPKRCHPLGSILPSLCRYAGDLSGNSQVDHQPLIMVIWAGSPRANVATLFRNVQSSSERSVEFVPLRWSGKGSVLYPSCLNSHGLIKESLWWMEETNTNKLALQSSITALVLVSLVTEWYKTDIWTFPLHARKKKFSNSNITSPIERIVFQESLTWSLKSKITNSVFFLAMNEMLCDTDIADLPQ